MTATNITLSPPQLAALDRARTWLETETFSKPVFRLFGHAGAGKTVLARHIAALVNDEAVYCAFTGKAASVLRQNGCEDATTIHSLVYEPRKATDGSIRYLRRVDGPIFSARLIIVDEASMVDDQLATDLLSFRVPILLLGDPAQLPPVKGGGALAAGTPDVLLTMVHRQAQGSPILQLSIDVREGRCLAPGAYGTSSVMREEDLSPGELLAADQIIVGRNATRESYNQIMRALKGLEGDLPVQGDRLVCLANHGALGLSNGETFLVAGEPMIRGDAVTLGLAPTWSPAEDSFEVTISAAEFRAGRTRQVGGRAAKPHFDFGFALTCHKAQGSQWPNVLVIDESGVFGSEASRWLYTAITRASDRVTIAR